MKIRPYQIGDQANVIALWDACGLIRPWNDPYRDIERKLSVQPELFLVGVDAQQRVIASAMVGFDGHRGWVNYLAVAPDKRRLSLGRQLMNEAERLLKERGCPKLNLQVRSGNLEVLEFYQKLGYVQDEVVSLGKRLIHDSAPE
ncbi:MAG: GNAT family acetyltransferase [Methylomonas sp.]